RRECREFAEMWVGIQAEEFQRLGVIGDWKNPYTTMAFAAEAQIAAEIAKFAVNGGLYRGARPVLWSVVEKTALADAEVEYHDHVSPTIFVAFPVVEPARGSGLDGAEIVIWTTTPWTIPGNRAIATAADETYVRLRVTEVGEGAKLAPGREIVVAEALVEQVCQGCRIVRHEIVGR